MFSFNQVMKSCIEKTLQKCHSHKYRSVAFPAMGTGNLQFPTDVAATTMFTAVQQFAQTIGTTTIQDIQFVLYAKDNPTVNVSEPEKSVARGHPKLSMFL